MNLLQHSVHPNILNIMKIVSSPISASCTQKMEKSSVQNKDIFYFQKFQELTSFIKSIIWLSRAYWHNDYHCTAFASYDPSMQNIKYKSIKSNASVYKAGLWASLKSKIEIIIILLIFNAVWQFWQSRSHYLPSCLAWSFFEQWQNRVYWRLARFQRHRSKRIIDQFLS